MINIDYRLRNRYILKDTQLLLFLFWLYVHMSICMTAGTLWLEGVSKWSFAFLDPWTNLGTTKVLNKIKATIRKRTKVINKNIGH